MLQSHNTDHKISSNIIVDDLHKLEYRICYTETRFNEDKWAEWSSSQPPVIILNIYEGFTATLIVDNINRENKDLNPPETHNTNSTLIQNCPDD